MKFIILILAILLGTSSVKADDDYKTSKEYLTLRDSMRNAFNSGDSARFFPALKNLQDYLLNQDDLHAYYTQRCNEIVFLMNQQRIFEAYKRAQAMTKELREKKLDKEMYMAYNMLGHLNRYCGNRETAKENFRQVIRLMEEAGYYESMPPIYMNLVNVSLSDDPDEAQRMLEKAKEIAEKYSPERVFDIETRQTLSYFNRGNIPAFLEGYKKYREGVAEGKTSVHGRSVDIYYESLQGNVDKAVKMAYDALGDEAHETATIIYEQAGRWKEAYESLKKQTTANDSVNNVILSNSMQEFRDEMTVYDMERQVAKTRIITLGIIIILLLMLIMAFIYITFSRRRHMRQLKRAYEHALESDKLKAAFIRNMSHEVRTPLNVIAGFAQVLADPDLSPDAAKRKEMAHIIEKNNYLITSQIDEMIELALNESAGDVTKDDHVGVNDILQQLAKEKGKFVNDDVTINVCSNIDDGFFITTNRDMLKRAIVPLIDNAMKYTAKGTITLGASVTDDELKLTVEDTGCGIPEAEAEHIFERFVKLDTFKEGIGLGLPLCRVIIARLGGTISLDTSYKEGARFVIRLNIG
jgi:signal transduction histidine kinase